MYNWFESYDHESYMTAFSNNNYAKYNPFSQDTLYFTASMKASHSYEMMLHQFKNYLETAMPENELKKRIHDPLAQICLSNAVKQLNMIKTVFETEGLLGWTDDFNDFCVKVLDFVNTEKFYIYTCTQMIQVTASTNAKAFYRERAFHLVLRLFYFYAYLKQSINQTKTVI